ncbi:APC family permease [Chryseobacterium sp. PET-29]|uniref:APC family permease n=1 Tax=Chryseobacterium sp. PET-29 TaxID=2983267 RepID=UPI0021E58598|nr:APC family permease [Chryseobacterium sp. PET-29]
MELKIKPFPKNNYPKTGVLIRSSSPQVWLQEMELLGIDLNAVQSFAIPSQEPNVLYGCFFVFTHNAPADIGQHSYFQCFDNRLFIPENTDFYPKLIAEDWKYQDARYIIMHPDFGLVRLKEEIDWITVLQDSSKTELVIRKPLNGINIPQKIRSFQVHMNDDDLLEQLMNPQTDEEWMKNLPFDLKKVMEGNLEEIEKYIAYITKYPERAVYFGVPLDIHGNSRGGWGDFNFDFGMFGMGGDPIGADKQSQNSSEKSKDSWKVLIGFIVLVVIIIFVLDSKKNNPEEIQVSNVSTDLYNDHTVETVPENKLAFESGVTKIDMVIDSLYGKERRQLIQEYEQVNGTGDVILWKIEEYRLKEKKSRDSLKNVYLKKTEDLVKLKTEGYHTKILDSIRKDTSNTMTKISQKLLADDLLEMRKRVVSDSLSRIYGTLHTTDPTVVFHKETGKKIFNTSGDVEKGKTSVSEITWMILAMMGLVAGYSYFVRKKPLYLGGEYVSEGIKMILIIILAASLLYIFYPLIKTFGYNWLVWLLIIGVIVLLYRLFSKDMDILKSGKNEK